jgi:hypothetical protein
MPYIKKVDNGRAKFDKVLNQIKKIGNKGDLEYCIFKLMKTYMKDKEYRYMPLHDATYAAIHCGDEFRRRFLDPREDEAMRENGDIE